MERRIQNVEPTDTNGDGVQDSGEQQEVAAHADFVHTYAFNSANRLIRQDLDAYGSSPSTVTTVYEYDARQLLTGIREHEGNVHARRYDERNLLFEEVMGASDSLTSKTTRYDYDPNGNLVQVVDDDGNTAPQVKVEYDAFDRPTAWQDELGNRVEVTYDVASLVRQTVAKGQARGDPGDAFTSYLSNSLTEYDEAGRAFQESQELFNAVEALALQGLTRLSAPVDLSLKRVASGELVTSTRAFSSSSLVLATFDDNAHRTVFEFDAANRLTRIKDALGSTVDFVFDKNSNVIRMIEGDMSSDGLNVDVFYSETFYDELDRTIATVSHLGNTRRFLYDSRHNVVQVSDAMAGTGVAEIDDLRTAAEHATFPQFTATDPPAVTLVNARGNTTRMAYDGLSRLLSTTRDLRSDGTGGSSVTGTIVTQQAWDGNSRVSSRTDPNGNVTSYVYDHQNRVVGEVYADQTFSHTVYNRTGTVDTSRDPRGVVKQLAYDALERAVSASFSNLPPGQGQTTFQAWRWDGLSRQTRAEDDDTIVESYFDSFSRLTQDKQRIATGTPRSSSAQALNAEVQGTFKRVFDGVGNVVKQIYPSTTTFKRTYDDVDRLATVAEGATTLASYAHTGMGDRRLSRTYPVPSVQQSLTFDADRRVVRLDAVRTTDNQRIRGFAYAWDREDNRRFERRLNVNTNASETAGPGEFYRYDSAYRLVHDDRDVATGSLDLVANNAATVTSPTVDVFKATDYMLDAAGNRRQTTVDSGTSVYQLSTDSQTRDAAMNQYTRIGSTYLSHDAAGNTLSSSELGLQRFFDAENRLVQWAQAGKDIRYRYDAYGRRVLKQDANGSFASVLYFYDGWHDAEEATTGGVVTKRYVYGEDVDEPIRVTLADAADSDNDGNTTELVDLYYHQNSLGSVVALTTTTGSVVESYRYSAYGSPTIFNKNGVEVSTTQVKQPFMFTGRRWDFEEGSNLYYYRLRYLDPAIGRFISRDPLGAWADAGQRGSGQSYAACNPVNELDPWGLTSIRGDDSLRRAQAELTKQGSTRDTRARLLAELRRNGQLPDGLEDLAKELDDYETLLEEYRGVSDELKTLEQDAAQFDKDYQTCTREASKAGRRRQVDKVQFFGRAAHEAREQRDRARAAARATRERLREMAERLDGMAERIRRMRNALSSRARGVAKTLGLTKRLKVIAIFGFMISLWSLREFSKEVECAFAALRELTVAFEAEDWERVRQLADDPGFKSRLEDDFLRLGEIGGIGAKKPIEDALTGDVEDFLRGLGESVKGIPSNRPRLR